MFLNSKLVNTMRRCDDDDWVTGEQETPASVPGGEILLEDSNLPWYLTPRCPCSSNYS